MHAAVESPSCSKSSRAVSRPTLFRPNINSILHPNRLSKTRVTLNVLLLIMQFFFIFLSFLLLRWLLLVVPDHSSAKCAAVNSIRKVFTVHFQKYDTNYLVYYRSDHGSYFFLDLLIFILMQSFFIVKRHFRTHTGISKVGA